LAHVARAEPARLSSLAVVAATTRAAKSVPRSSAGFAGAILGEDSEGAVRAPSDKSQWK